MHCIYSKVISTASREDMNKNSDKTLKLNSRLSDKYKLNDILSFDKERRSIQQLITNNPLYLWELIHTKHSNVSLVRDAYAKLKARIARINPRLVEEVEKKHRYHKASKRLRKELREGKLGNEGSSFKKIASRKIIND